MDLTASVSFDRIADRYDDTRGGLARGRTTSARLAPWIEGPRVLEIGVGTGAVGVGLGDDGHHVVGVDLSPAMLARAHERLGNVVMLGDARRLPIATGSVDAVIAVWVLHLVGDVPAALGEVDRVLRSGGRLVAARAGGGTTKSDDIEVVMDDLRDRLRSPQDSAPALRAISEQLGWRVLEDRDAPGDEWQLSPEDNVRLIEQRVLSDLWDVSDDQWAREVEPTIQRLRALPDPHLPRLRRGVVRLFIAEKPHGPETRAHDVPPRRAPL